MQQLTYNGPQLNEVLAVHKIQCEAIQFIPPKFHLRCCYRLAGFQPKMLIRSTKRTFFNFLKGRFLYFISLFISTLQNVNNFVYKNVQLNCNHIKNISYYCVRFKTKHNEKATNKRTKRNDERR